MTATLERPAALVAAGLLPVGSYARRSKKATGDGKGAFINIADQHAQNRAYAAVEFPGRPVVEYDDNMSAWNPDVTRDDWERMLDDTRAGNLHAVIGRYADRLTRQPEQGEALLTACKKGKAELHTTSAGHVTSALMFRIELALAAEESDQKSRRQMDHHRRLADAGGFHGGRRRFGYTSRMTEIIPAEKAALLDAAERVLAGESLNSITKRWNRDGIRTPNGSLWRSPNVGKLLRSPHLAGMRVHEGKVTKAALWPAIFDAATHQSLVTFLGDPDRVVSGFNGVRKYLLSGQLVCGVCGGKMHGRNTRLKSGPGYVCTTGYHTQAPVSAVDDTVRGLIFDRLSTVDASGTFVAPVDAERANARAAERLALVARRDDELPDAVADGDMTPTQVKRATARIEKRLAELEAEAANDDTAARLPSRVLSGLTGVPADVVAERFDALAWDRQRAVIAVLGTPVLGTAFRKGGPRYVFEPERVTMRYADGAGG